MSKRTIVAVLCIFILTVIGAFIFLKPYPDTASTAGSGQSVASGEEPGAATPGEEQNIKTGEVPDTAGEKQEPAAGKKVINVYTTDRELGIILQKYAEIHPEFIYNVVYPDNVDFYYDLNHHLQNGDGDRVDLYCVPAAYAQWYIKGDYGKYASPYEELGIDVENALQEAEIPQTIIDAGTNSNGELIALPYKKNVNLFMYRRSIAKAVWGTDDPERIAEIIGTGTGKWDRFLEAAETLKEHEVYVLPEYQCLSHLVETDISSDFLSNDSLKISPSWEEYMDNAKYLLDNGCIKITQSWGEQWLKELDGKSDKPIFGLFTQDFQLKELFGWLKTTASDWAVCLPPVSTDTGFYTGLTDMDYYTGIMVNKNSPNKDVLGPLIEWITLDSTDTGLQYRLANDTFHSDLDYSTYGGKRSVISGAVLKSTDNSKAFLGGQNLNTVIYDALQTPSGKHYAPGFDLFIVWYYRTDAYLKGEINKETAIAEYRQSAGSTFPEHLKRDGFSAEGKLISLVGTRELNIYSYDSGLVDLVKQYAKTHPEFNFKVNWFYASQIDSHYTLSMISNNMQSDNGEIVDIYCVPASYADEMIKGEFSQHACTYKELGIDIDVALREADIPQHIVDNGTNPDGELIALPYLTGANVFVYRRSIARDVWGTDDPEQVGKILGAGTEKWDVFLEAAQTLKEHGCYIVNDISNLVWMIDTSEVFKSDKIDDTGFSTSVSVTSYQIDPRWEEFMDVSKDMVDKGYMQNFKGYYMDWIEQMNGKGEKPVFGFVYPYEYIPFLLRSDDYLKSDTNDWAICVPPFKTVTATYTGIMVNRNSPNKDELGPLIKWLTLDCTEAGLQYSQLKGTTFDEASNPDLYNYFGGVRPVISRTLLKNNDCTLEFLGGQNISPIIDDILDAPTGKHYEHGGYPSDVFDYWVLFTKEYINGEKDKETMKTDFFNKVEELKEAYKKIYQKYDILFLLP